MLRIAMKHPKVVVQQIANAANETKAALRASRRHPNGGTTIMNTATIAPRAAPKLQRCSDVVMTKARLPAIAALSKTSPRAEIAWH